MAALNNDAKMYIVQRLACFDTPSEVVKAIKVDMGLTITPQQAEAYDPNKKTGQGLSKRWRAIFEETRKVFLEDTSQIAVSHRAVRLRALNRMAEKAEGMGNMALAAQLLEQAAKECGDQYTNRHKHELTGKDGGPLEQRTTVVDENAIKAALSDLHAEF